MSSAMLALLLAAALGYQDLVTLFARWREFQRPRDYAHETLEAQRRELPAWQKRLQAIDPRGWPVPQQVDWHIVRAEMNGLDFDFRVLKPWERDPAFYLTVFTDETDQPAREGPHAQVDSIEAIPALLEQARRNLTGNARDLWVTAIPDVKAQVDALTAMAKSKPAAQKALDATVAFVQWLEQEAPKKTGPSGIGVENYDWYLANVQLVPYRWSDEVALMQAELTRARAMIALEEHNNRALPQQEPVASAEEHQRKFSQAVTDYMAFLAKHDVLTIRPDMDPALRTHVGSYTPKRPLEFFYEVDYRDPILMRTHGYHWFDLARMAHDPNPDPIRRGALLYNIFNTRTEGFATAMEELAMTLGLCEGRPRSRELIYVLIGQRAARALADLHMTANEFTYEQAVKFASDNTPRGWLRTSGQLVWFEQHLYLEQPGYGTSYLIGKLLMEDILAHWHGTLREYMDRKDAAGLIPASLLRWEMTGQPWIAK